MQLTPEMNRQFDDLLEQILAELPEELRKLFEEIPLVVEDYPAMSLLRKLGIRRPDYLRGLHTGVPLTRRSVDHSGTLPTVITIYRLGILSGAIDRNGRINARTLRTEIRKTVLHELGHHFGLDEADLRRYGYG